METGEEEDLKARTPRREPCPVVDGTVPPVRTGAGVAANAGAEQSLAVISWPRGVPHRLSHLSDSTQEVCHLCVSQRWCLVFH
ncbi:hypothetical protein UPYG_G00029310 [Umbra pygmaea]|uniref:Uncharacterized protein n=1 Tax=Umbra pygmaea TaxID=75934 RepID=A0ABD0XPT9_UMBPY